MQITPHLYWYPWQGYGNNCNTVILAGEKTVLFDPGHVRNEYRENCLEQLESKMSQDGFSLEKVDLIICTHTHPDHFESAVFIRQHSGAKLAVHRDEEQILKLMSKAYQERMGDKAPDLSVDILLQEGELEIGANSRIALQVLHTPGHSPGSVSFYCPGEKALITGDTIFMGSIGRTDLPGGDMKAMSRSVKKLNSIGGVEWVLPGHMDLIEGSDNIKKNFSRIKNFFLGIG